MGLPFGFQGLYQLPSHVLSILSCLVQTNKGMPK